VTMLIEELQALSADWRSWLVVGLLALVSLYSVGEYFRCPYARGTARIDDDEMQAAQRTGTVAGPRFALTMLAAVALTLTGLFMIAEGVKPALALAALVTGIVLIQTEPPRLRAREYRTLVAARRDGPPEALADARYRLRTSYRELALTNVVLLSGVTGVLLAF